MFTFTATFTSGEALVWYAPVARSTLSIVCPRLLLAVFLLESVACGTAPNPPLILPMRERC